MFLAHPRLAESGTEEEEEEEKKMKKVAVMAAAAGWRRAPTPPRTHDRSGWSHGSPSRTSHTISPVPRGPRRHALAAVQTFV